MIKKNCPISGQTFEITDEDLTFYKKMGVPMPTLCPEERQRRRLAWRNERKLYWRKCDGTNKKILTMYSGDKLFPIYTPSYWYSDNWDPKKYGKDFDFEKTFFEQFHALQQSVPRPALSVV